MTTDRKMTPRLAAALDGLTGAERRVLKVIAAESEHDWLRGLLLGLVAELITSEMREVELLHDLEVDRQADVDRLVEGAPPLPPVEGAPWFPEAPPDDAAGLE